MEKLYKVGDIAKIFNVSIDTLRYYDKLDLIRPWKVGENGYRYYSKAQFDMISTVLFLKSAGTSLADLAEILRNQAGEKAILQELDTRKKEIDETIQTLRYKSMRIDMLRENIISVERTEEISLQEVPSLWMLSRDFEEDHEIDVEEIVKINQSIAGEWVSFANTMSTVSKENLLNGRYHEYKRFGFISEYPYKDESDYVEVFGNCLCVCANAKIKRLDHSDIDTTYDRMVNYIKDNGLTVAGETVERSMLDLYGSEGEPFVHHYRIYIPVRK